MDFRTFDRRAREAFELIPPEFKEGIDGLDVRAETVPHPELPDIYTLGECLTEEYPSEFGGAGEVRSIVVLYYGSFLALARLDDEFDWDDEIFETVTHEVRHHLESLALDDTLEQQDYAEEQNFIRRHSSTPNQFEERRSSHGIRHNLETLAPDATIEEPDYAEDQNFARREGASFDPHFYRAGARVADRAWEVGGDIFLEVPLGARERASGQVEVTWDGRTHRVGVGQPVPDPPFVTVRPADAAGAEVVAVLVPSRGVWEWIRAVVGRGSGSR